MWQKQLKDLKKQVLTQHSQAKDPKPKAVEPTQDIDFATYCEALKVAPIKQDTKAFVAAPKMVKSNTHNQAFSSSNDGSLIDFFDSANAKPEFYRHGQRNMPRDLRNGKYPIAKSLDLHNYTRTHAIDLLERFIEANTQAKCVKIIHGVGLNSANNQPVLLGVVRKFLEHHPLVLAYSYGSSHQGDQGVTIVKFTNS